MGNKTEEKYEEYTADIYTLTPKEKKEYEDYFNNVLKEKEEQRKKKEQRKKEAFIGESELLRKLRDDIMRNNEFDDDFVTDEEGEHQND